MRDALFQGYAGAGFTHSSGGGLLEPADFHGMAALLIKDRVKGSKRRQQRALQRLMDPVKGNLLVQLTLTCLEREIASSQPTIPSCSTHPDSESDDDVGDGATLLNPPEFTGAAVSMLPPGDEAEAIIDDVPVIGSTISRLNNEESLHEAETTSANPTVEALTFPTLMNAKGGFRNTPSGCTHRHYIHKTFGSVAHHCARAQEVPATSMCIHPLPPNCGLNCACFCSLCGTTIKTKFVGAHLETSHDAWWEDTLRPRPTNRISKSTSQMFKSSGMSLQKRYASSCAQLLVPHCMTPLCPVTEPYFAVSGSSQSSFQSPRCRKHTRVVWRKL